MAGDRIHNLIRYLRRASAAGDSPAVPDVQLVERFLTQRDESAFELLVWRHGAMVLGVCRRVLGDAHEAEDAFQAAFLVLARKAGSAARHRSVGGWLYTVALRVALRARARRSARTARERPLDEPPAAAELDPAGEAGWREVRQVIDEEISRLPEKYRLPFVLVHLEGRSSAEVARELGCPVGTVASWLTRARARLRSRLVRRGITPTPGLLVGLAPKREWLSQAAAAAARAASRGAAGVVSPEAAVLAEGVVRTLGMARAKVVVAALLLAATATGLAVTMLPRAEAPARPAGLPAVQWNDARPVKPAKVPEPVQLATLRGHTGGINAIALSPDGKILASAGQDFLVKLWNVETATETATLGKAANPRMPGEQIRTHEWQVNAVAFSPDGAMLASGSYDKTVKLWDVAMGEEQATLRGHAFPVYAVAFRPDGKVLASAGGASPAAIDTTPRMNLQEVPKDPQWFKEHGEVKVWDLAAGKERTFFHGDTGRVKSLAFSPDGKTLAAGIRDGAIRLWDVATGGELACLQEGPQSVCAVAFSPDGKTLAAVQEDKADMVKLWDLASGQVRAHLQGHTGWVHAVAFSPDGRTLATAGNVPSPDPRQPYDETGEARLWDTATGQPRGGPMTFLHYGRSVAFGDRGKILAAGGPRGTQRNLGAGPGEITLWDLDPQSRTRP